MDSWEPDDSENFWKLKKPVWVDRKHKEVELLIWETVHLWIKLIWIKERSNFKTTSIHPETI